LLFIRDTPDTQENCGTRGGLFPGPPSKPSGFLKVLFSIFLRFFSFFSVFPLYPLEVQGIVYYNGYIEMETLHLVVCRTDPKTRLAVRGIAGLAVFSLNSRLVSKISVLEKSLFFYILR
jgi:hypothetical protein